MLARTNIVYMDQETRRKIFLGPTWVEEFGSKLLARTNIVYMDQVTRRKKNGTNMVRGIWVKNVGAGQHRLHGPGDAGKFFFGGQHDLMNLGANVGAGQQIQHVPS